ncbi:MAG: hypothetical protein ABH803_00615 [Candidatus Micrarchaeota archaeon]
MKIVSGKIIEVNAKKMKDEPQKSVNINVNIESAQKEGDKLQVVYSVTNTYEPDVATLKVTGELTIEIDKKQLDENLKTWSKEKTLEIEVMELALNASTYAMSAVGTLLAYAIGVQAPINVPKAKLTKEPGKAA